MLRWPYIIIAILLLPISHAITQGFYIDTHYNTTNEDVRLNTGETTGRFYGRVVVLDEYSDNISVTINDDYSWSYSNNTLNWSAVQPVFELNSTHTRIGFAHRLVLNVADVKEYCSWRDLTVNGSDHTTSTYKCSKDYLTLSLHSSDDNYIMHENCAGFNDNVCIEVSRADACNPCGWYTSNASIISDFLLNSYIYKELLINISTGNPSNWNLWGRYNQIPQVAMHHAWPSNATHGNAYALFRDSGDTGRYANANEGSNPVIPYNNKFSLTSGADNSSSVVFAGVCHDTICNAKSTAMTGGIKQSDTTNNLAFLGYGIQFNAFYGYSVDWIFYDGYTAVNTTLSQQLYDNSWSQVVWGDWVEQTTISNITISTASEEEEEEPPAEDSCTYTSGNWQVNLSDSCEINTSINIGSNCLVLTGTGNFSIESSGSVTAACRRFEPDVLNGNSIFAIKTGGAFNWVI